MDSAVSTEWIAAQLAVPWECGECGNTDGRDPGGGRTTGICAECLRRKYPRIAERIIAQATIVTPAGRLIG